MHGKTFVSLLTKINRKRIIRKSNPFNQHQWIRAYQGLSLKYLRTKEGEQIIKKSEENRFKDVSIVDKVLEIDTKWRETRKELDGMNRYVKYISKIIGNKIKDAKKSGKEVENSGAKELKMTLDDLKRLFDRKTTEDLRKNHFNQYKVDELTYLSKYISTTMRQEIENSCQQLENERDTLFSTLGNIVWNDQVPISNTEDDNVVLDTFDSGKPLISQPKNHVDAMMGLQQLHLEEGSNVAGERGYYLSGQLMLLERALVSYAMDFLYAANYSPMLPPFFMRETYTAAVSQLSQFSEELYSIHGGSSETKYLIPTSEQPLVAFHANKTYTSADLPIKHAGYSTCFRKEAGRHGHDTAGIFRVHQFDKVEQFVVTTPKESESALKEMVDLATSFYKSLGMSFRVVDMVSGKLNDAAARKIDVEVLFPASNTYRELVSASNCTDFQSRRVHTRLSPDEYVHMLNATLCASTRTLCALLEYHQTEEGIVVPEALQKYVPFTFIPFQQN